MQQLRHNLTLLLAAAAVCSTLVPAAPTRADADAVRIDKLKAAFIYNFIKFTEWPAAAFTETTSPLRVAVTGNAEVVEYLGALIGNQKVGGRAVEIRTLRLSELSAEEMRGYHVLYCGREARNGYREALAVVRGRPILTIGGEEIPDFAENGGMLGLVLRGGRLSFEVNLQSIRQSRVTISSKVLRLGKVVKGEQP